MKDTTKTLTFRLRVRSTEFEVLADKLGGTLEYAAKRVHGARLAVCTDIRVNGRKLRGDCTKLNRDEMDCLQRNLPAGKWCASCRSYARGESQQ
jgi:hypothetical protein